MARARRGATDVRGPGAAGYTRGPTATLEGFLQSHTAAELTGRKAMVQFVLEQETAAVSRYLEMRNDVGAAVTNASENVDTGARPAPTQLAENQARGDAALTTFGRHLESRVAGPVISLPVVGTYAFGSDFGAPRMVGSTDEHQHQGNDIVAPLGAQLVAVEPGMVAAMGNDRLGGIKLWLAGRSGTYYYDADPSRGFRPTSMKATSCRRARRTRIRRQHGERGAAASPICTSRSIPPPAPPSTLTRTSRAGCAAATDGEGGGGGGGGWP